MAVIHLTIVTPLGKFFDEDAQKVIVRTTGGDVCILPNHIDYAASLGIGEGRVTDAKGNTRHAYIEGGMIHVAANDVQVICNHFQWKDE